MLGMDSQFCVLVSHHLIELGSVLRAFEAGVPLVVFSESWPMGVVLDVAIDRVPVVHPVFLPFNVASAMGKIRIP